MDPDYARRGGGRWNPPDSFPVLYLNEDLVTARLNLRRFIADWPYEPEDLRGDSGPLLAGAALPRDQVVADAHTPAGVAALRLPVSYPVDPGGELVVHPVCQEIGLKIKVLGLRGVRARSARSPAGEGRELAWFPATGRSRARLTSVLAFDEWYWR